MRNRQKQRALRRAGVKREERIGPRNEEYYSDPTPREAVERAVKERKARNKWLTEKR